jgi:hypothetical protein
MLSGKSGGRDFSYLEDSVREDLKEILEAV